MLKGFSKGINQRIRTKEIFTAGAGTEVSEPTTAVELFGNVLRGLIANSSPEAITQVFINEFVLKPTAEEPKVVAMFDTPSGQLVMGLPSTRDEARLKAWLS